MHRVSDDPFRDFINNEMEFPGDGDEDDEVLEDAFTTERLIESLQNVTDDDLKEMDEDFEFYGKHRDEIMVLVDSESLEKELLSIVSICSHWVGEEGMKVYTLLERHPGLFKLVAAGAIINCQNKRIE